MNAASEWEAARPAMADPQVQDPMIKSGTEPVLIQDLRPRSRRLQANAPAGRRSLRSRVQGAMTVRAIKTVIPPKSNRKIKRDCDFAHDRERNVPPQSEFEDQILREEWLENIARPSGRHFFIFRARS